MIEKIISGGQVGADIGALRAAKRLGVETGGWMPLGFKTINGKKPEYAELYGLQQTMGTDYVDRTRLNVIHSDGTIRIATNFASYGEKATLREINFHNKPYYDISASYNLVNEDQVRNVLKWIEHHDIKILNVAGNAYPHLEWFAEQFVENLLVEGGSASWQRENVSQS